MSVVVAHEQLVAEECCQHLRAVVVEAAMPDAMVQLEQAFEPVVERLDGLAAAGVQPFSSATLEELPSRQASPMGFIARRGRLFGRGTFAATAILRAQETSARPPILLVVLNALPQLVA